MPNVQRYNDKGEFAFCIPGLSEKIHLWEGKKKNIAERLRMGDESRRGLFPPLPGNAQWNVVFFFSLIHAITKENCTKGKTKVRTLLETSSGQESAAKLDPKPTSLPGLCVLLDSCMR